MAYSQDEIKKQMQANSAAWHTADAATKKQLEAANQSLGKQLGASYNSSTGTWSNSSGGSLYGSTSSNKGSSSGSSSSGSSSGYVAKGTYNDRDVTAEDKAKIQGYKDQYEAAKAAGNQSAMDAAHAAAEAIRKQYNYLGGDDGSDYIGLPLEEIFDIPSYNFTTEKPSYSYDTAQPTFDSKYDEQIDALLNSILNRDDFKYNVEEDPLYQQYKQQYLREGNRAMNDTLASAAASAGGMNSYAVTAAQQANNYYTSQMGDKIPELYNLAYNMYLDDIDNEVRNLGLLEKMDDTQYGRYRDTMSDWRDDRNFTYNQYRDDVYDWTNDRNFTYGQYRDSMGDYFNNRDFQYGVSRDEVADTRYDNEWGYNTSQNDKTLAYSQAMDFLNAGVMPAESVLAAAGISASEAQAYINKVNAAAALSRSSGSSGSKSSGSTSKKKSEVEYVPDEPLADEKEYSQIDTQSVMALGYGPISYDKLNDLYESGEIDFEERNGKLVAVKSNDPKKKVQGMLLETYNPFAGFSW